MQKEIEKYLQSQEGKDVLHSLIKEYVKDNLSVELVTGYGSDYDYEFITVDVTLTLDDQVISSSHDTFRAN